MALILAQVFAFKALVMPRALPKNKKSGRPIFTLAPYCVILVIKWPWWKPEECRLHFNKENSWNIIYSRSLGKHKWLFLITKLEVFNKYRLDLPF